MTDFLQRPSATIHYRVHAPALAAGDKPKGWLTLVNGYTRSMKDFASMAGHFAKLGYSVLVLDNRGSGETEWQGDFTLEDLASDVEALWDELGVSQSHLLGISMGGRIAQQVARQAADRVESLMLVSTTATGEFVMADDERRWGDTLPAIKETMARYFSPRFLARNKLLVDAMAKNIHASVGAGTFNSGAKAQDSALKGADSTSFLGEIAIPTLILHGRDDRIIRCEAGLHLFDHIPESELIVMAGVGHLMLAECPKRLYGEVARFIGS